MSDIIEEVKRTPMHHRQKINFIILGLVLLASGFGLGASTTFFCLQDRIMPEPPIGRPDGDPNGRGPGPDFNPVERWAAEYDLTDEQKVLVKAALDRQHQAFREMFVAGKEKMDAAKDMLVQDMNDILTPEQFNSWHEEFKKRLERRRRGWGRRPPRNRGDGPRKEGYGSRGRDGDAPPGPPRYRGNGPHKDGHRNRDQDTPREDSPQ